MIPIPTTKDFHKNLNKVKGDLQPCAICGRGVDTAKPHVEVYTYAGGNLVTRAEYEAKAGDTWLMPVGPDCARRSHAILEPFLAAN